MPQRFTPSGQRTRRVQIQSASNAPDPTTGEPAQTWSTLATVWAKIAGVSSREVYQSGQFSAQATHVVNIVWSASLAVSGGMRVLYSTRTLLVQAVENVNEANRELNLICLEIDGVAS